MDRVDREPRPTPNPLNGSPLLPEIPEPRTEDLQPFMHGWSPYGPT